MSNCNTLTLCDPADPTVKVVVTDPGTADAAGFVSPAMTPYAGDLAALVKCDDGGDAISELTQADGTIVPASCVMPEVLDECNTPFACGDQVQRVADEAGREVTSGVTTSYDDAALGAMGFGAAAALPVLTLEVPQLTNEHPCRSAIVKWTYRIGAERMAIGENNRFFLGITGAGDAVPPIFFDSRGNTGPEAFDEGDGHPVFGHQSQTVGPGGTTSIPPVVMTLAKLAYQTHPQNAYVGNAAVTVHMTWNLI